MDEREDARRAALAAAQDALARGEFEQARLAVQPLVEADPDDVEAQDLLVDVAVAEDRALGDAGVSPTPMGYGPEALSPGYVPPDPAAEEARRVAAAAGFGDLRAVDDGRRPQVAAPPTRPSPPFGVAILAALDFIGGGFAVFFALLLLFSGTGEGVLFALILGPLALVAFALARGLWRLAAWAWYVTIALSAIGVLSSIVTFGGDPVGSAFGVVFNVAVIAYLLHARPAFGLGGAPPAGPGAPRGA